VNGRLVVGEQHQQDDGSPIQISASLI
jgi:hypothetical protein